MQQQSRYIDIFAGCGGLSLGLHLSGWEGVFAVEKSSMAFETLSYNLIEKNSHFTWPSWLPQKNYDINYFIKKYREHLKDLSGKIDMIVGGPPCQGFSMAGRRNEADKRNSLIRSYIRFIKLVKPKLLLFENVKGFTLPFKKEKKTSKLYSEYVLSELRKLGYDVQGRLIDFSEFGIPQKRQRFIIIGSKISTAEYIFEKIIENKQTILKQKGLLQEKKTTLKDAISDLLQSNGVIDSPDSVRFLAGKYSQPRTTYQQIMRAGCNLEYPDSHRFANHDTKTVSKFTVILNESTKNKNVEEHIRKRFNMKKHSVIPLDGNSCSPTLTTLPDDYIHYKEPRILTVREYARIQSFPDWYEFKEKYTTGGKYRKIEVPRYSQIGNAVPPLFAEIVGTSLLQCLKEFEKGYTLSKNLSVPRPDAYTSDIIKDNYLKAE
jgi:DNA (cytosine-5)-methyltransferase 1